MYIGIPAQIIELFPEQPERADVDCEGFAVSTTEPADAAASLAWLEGLARFVDEEFVRDLALNGA